MALSITIENSKQRHDKLYVGCLVVFWIIWTPLTCFVTFLAITHFHWFFVLWLVFGYLGVIGIPWTIIQSHKPQTLEASEDALIIRGTGVLFKNVIHIPREKLITLHIGHYEDGNDTESVVTLNLFSGQSPWTQRVMISPLAHPSEKRHIFHQLELFLSANGFQFEVKDEHPKTRSEQGSGGNRLKPVPHL